MSWSFYNLFHNIAYAGCGYAVAKILKRIIKNAIKEARDE
jgi:hypothetical protein